MSPCLLTPLSGRRSNVVFTGYGSLTFEKSKGLTFKNNEVNDEVRTFFWVNAFVAFLLVPLVENGRRPQVAGTCLEAAVNIDVERLAIPISESSWRAFVRMLYPLPFVPSSWQSTRGSPLRLSWKTSNPPAVFLGL